MISAWWLILIIPLDLLFGFILGALMSDFHDRDCGFW